jgi:hypothetical protein
MLQYACDSHIKQLTITLKLEDFGSVMGARKESRMKIKIMKTKMKCEV